MRRATLPIGLAALLLALAAAAPAGAAEPEVLASRSFDVRVDRAGGPVLVIDFALSLSEVDSYPVTITAIAGSTEEQVYDGTLAGGVYRLRAPLKRITSGAVRVVLRTKVINRGTERNDVFIVYQKWEASL